MTPATFIDPIALAIVGGGTAAATLLRSPIGDVSRALHALTTLPRRRFIAEPLLEQVAALGRIAKRHGVIALDRTIITDPDLRIAIAAIVDGASPDEVREIVAHARHARVERHCAAIEVWTGTAEAAPAMGMVGTLVGLAGMFATMTDPATIGGAMAVALLATLYGALIANFLAQPIAARLRARARAESFERARLEAPLVALAAREAPRPIQSVAA